MNRYIFLGLIATAALILCGGVNAQEPDEPAEPSEAAVTDTPPAPDAPVSAQTADTVTASATRMQLDTTQVTGSRELPKVLVIVPWKNPELVELTGRPLASLVEEALSPIDPAVFRRQVDYYNALNDDDRDDTDN